MESAKSRIVGAFERNRPAVMRTLLTTGSSLAIATVAVLLAPNWYEAQLALVPQSQSKSPGGAGLAAAAGAALAGDMPLDLNIGPTGGSDERIQAVLKSRSVSDAVIKKFDLITRYHDRNLERARKKLWKHCFTKLDKRPSVVTLTCEDKDPKLVAEMTNYFGEVGNSVFRRISTSSAGEERQFLETRVAQAHHDVEVAANKLREFQEQYRVIDLGEQSKAVVSALATMKADMLSKEIQLSYLNSFSSSDESTASQLRRQLSVMAAKMKTLEEAPPAKPSSNKMPGTGDARTVHEMFPPALDVPQLRFQLEQLYREQKVQETLFLLLEQRYEMAKVNEARDTSAFQILDSAVQPTYHSRPERDIILMVGAGVGLMLGVAWTLAKRRRPISPPVNG